MKKIYVLVLITISLALIITFSLLSNNTNSSSGIKQMEVHKVIIDGTDPFAVEKMDILKNWTFTKEEDIRVVFNKYVIGNLEPSYTWKLDDTYATYYLKITYEDNSVEEWLLKLDEKFEKDGLAENKYHRYKYKSIAKKYVKKIGKLLER